MSLSPEDKNYLAEELQKVYDRIEKTETTLLTEFHKWAAPNEARQRSQREAIHALELAVDDLTARVARLEPKS